MSIEVAAGVQKTIIKEGQGPAVKKGDNIEVNCTGFLANGTKFWSTKDPGQKTFSFRVGVGQVIVGWDEGCLNMKKGETARLAIVGSKAYRDRGFPTWGIGPNADLVFEIEVLNITQ